MAEHSGKYCNNGTIIDIKSRCFFQHNCIGGVGSQTVFLPLIFRDVGFHSSMVPTVVN